MEDVDYRRGDIDQALGRAAQITDMSDESMSEKFGRKTKNVKKPFKFSPEFEVEGYLHHRGHSFIHRFDPNSYLYITKAIDSFSAANGRPLHQRLAGIGTKLLIIAFTSDWLYPPYQSQQIVKAAKMAGIDTTYCELRSPYGHDAFLLEWEEQTYLYTHFLRKVSHG